MAYVIQVDVNSLDIVIVDTSAILPIMGVGKVLMLSEHEIYVSLGQRIRSARESANLRQDELADRVHMTRTSITNIERGNQRIQIHTLFALAKALDVTPQELLPPTNTQSLRAEAIKSELEKQSSTVQSWVLEILNSSREDG